LSELQRNYQENSTQGLALIFAGANGAGKDTLEARFTNSQPRAVRVVRHITRLPAVGEVDGRDYHFVDEEQFSSLINEGAFMEYANYIGSSSGTSTLELETRLRGADYASLTANFEDGLTLHRRLGAHGLASTCFFISPVPEDVMRSSPDDYIDALRSRMLQRARSSDLIEGRLVRAAGYRELYIANEESVIYVDNSDGELDRASRYIAAVALDKFSQLNSVRLQHDS
jgi:guanylate kinase